MNAAGERAIRAALSNVEDNLYRYRHFGTPDQLTGNGETFASVIASLEKERDLLRAALQPRAQTRTSENAADREAEAFATELYKRDRGDG